MKTIFLLCTSALFSCISIISAAQQSDPELKQEISLKDFKLNGNVKSVYQTQYAATGTEITVNPEYLLGEYGYEPSNKYDDKGWTLLFDESGRIIEKTNNWSIKYVYQYENNGSIKQIDISLATNFLGNYIYKYENGNPIEKADYDPINQLCGKVQYRYDAKGNLIELISDKYNNKGAVRKRATVHYTYEYDNHGNMTNKFSHDPKGYIRFKTSRKYDDPGNIVKYLRDSYTNKGDAEPVFEYNYKYDEQGKVTETNGFSAYNNPHLGEYISLYSPSNLNPYSSDKTYFTNHYQYDEQGNIITIESTGSRKDLSEYKYEYDTAGNWTKKQYWLNGVLQYTVMRKIGYYQ